MEPQQQIPTNDSIIITPNELLRLHENTKCNIKTTENILDAIDSLGGIDKILNDYLTIPQIHPNTQQLQQIHEILSSTTQNEAASQININQPQMNQIENPNAITYTLSNNNTFLHSYFGDKKASQIQRILHSKYSQILLFASIAAYIFLRQYLWDDNFSIYIICVSLALWIPIGVCWILSSNIKAFKLITWTFEVR